MASRDLSVFRQRRIGSGRSDGLDADHGDQGFVYIGVDYDGRNIGCLAHRRLRTLSTDKSTDEDAERPESDAGDDVRS